jgi:enoyl-CoA hydratase/carnithine racemase
MPELVLTERHDGGVALLRLNRPPMNPLSIALLGELRDAAQALAADPEVKGVVVAGSEKALAAGADIGELTDQAGARASTDAFRAAFDAVAAIPRPVIAAVRGYALGGGCELALACTLRTASTNAKLGLPEVSLGIIPGYGGTQRLARIAGPGVAREWVLTGDLFGAEEAHRLGIVNRVFAPEALREGTMKMVETILSRGPVAVRLALETIRRGMNMSQPEGEIIESDMFALAATTSDMREGMTAFLEKRKPAFVGR